MTDILLKVLAVFGIAALLWFLLMMIRFAVVYPRMRREGKQRLREPSIDGIETVIGFAPSYELIQFYRTIEFVSWQEFYLVDRSKDSPLSWEIGEFIPLEARHLKEAKKIAGVPGIPIAYDIDKGAYFVTRDGAIMLSTPSREVLVAADIGVFAAFEPRRDVFNDLAR